MDDLISRQAVIDALMEKDKKLRNLNWYDNPYAEGECAGIDEALSIISNLPLVQPAQPDVITASLEELINDYGEDGYFIVDGVNYRANELLNELKINSSVGEKFRKQITKTIVAYFMKFGD